MESFDTTFLENIKSCEKIVFFFFFHKKFQNIFHKLTLLGHLLNLTKTYFEIQFQNQFIQFLKTHFNAARPYGKVHLKNQVNF